MSVILRTKFELLCRSDCGYMSSRSFTEMGDVLANEADLLLMIKEVGLYINNEHFVSVSPPAVLICCVAVQCVREIILVSVVPLVSEM